MQEQLLSILQTVFSLDQDLDEDCSDPAQADIEGATCATNWVPNSRICWMFSIKTWVLFFSCGCAAFFWTTLFWVPFPLQGPHLKDVGSSNQRLGHAAKPEGHAAPSHKCWSSGMWLSPPTHGIGWQAVTPSGPSILGSQEVIQHWNNLIMATLRNEIREKILFLFHFMHNAS